MTHSKALEGAIKTAGEGEPSPLSKRPTIIPVTPTRQFFSPASSQVPLIADMRAIRHLLERILYSSDLTVAEVARRLGVRDNAVRQYFLGARSNPTLLTFLKICEAAGVRVAVELKRG